MNLTNKTVLITGASRGIGRAIALKLATEGANIAIVAKTTEQHPKLEGTIFSVAKEAGAVGSGNALPFQLDIRDEKAITTTINKIIDAFGGIDILINNASAINLSPTETLEAKRFDLMNSINVRGTFLMSQACVPHLKKSTNAHILNLSPPIDLHPKWFAQFTGYTMSKYGMSMVAIGLSEELKKYKIAVNALWPKTTIATAAVKNIIGGEEMMKRSRKPEIVADAAYYIVKRNSAACTGNFFIDEQVLQEEGITDLDHYSVTPGSKLMPDLFL